LSFFHFALEFIDIFKLYRDNDIIFLASVFILFVNPGAYNSTAANTIPISPNELKTNWAECLSPRELSYSFKTEVFFRRAAAGFGHYATWASAIRIGFWLPKPYRNWGLKEIADLQT
jgi:hypothetical protein